MASMAQIAFWHAMSKRRTWNATSFDRFLSAVDNNPVSFELFIQHLRDADHVDGKQAQHVQHSQGSEVADLKALSLTRCPKRKECQRHLISLWHAPLKWSNQPPVKKMCCCKHCTVRGGKMWESPRSQPYKIPQFPVRNFWSAVDSWVTVGETDIRRQRSFEDLNCLDCIQKRAYPQTNSLIVQTQILFNVVHLPGYHVGQATMSLFAFERAVHLRSAYPGSCSEGHLSTNDSLQRPKMTVRLGGCSASSTSSPSSSPSPSSSCITYHVSRI